MKSEKLKKKLRDVGCYSVRQGGNHEIWYSPITNKNFPIPRHTEIEFKTLKKISKQSGVKL